MRYLNNRAAFRCEGFSLLEMLVVLLLVSMLAGLLMQGFIYMSGVYGAVERRQKMSNSQQLLRDWLKGSVQGIVNNVDGRFASRVPFEGDQDYFRAISFKPLASVDFQGPTRTYAAYKIEWRLEHSAQTLRLMYGEALLAGGEWQWYVLREWPGAEASWRYWSNGQWYESFPVQGVGMDMGSQQLYLPSGIALTVKGLRVPFEVFIALNSNPARYRPPQEYGGF